VTPDLLDDVARLGPFGQGNPYPLFMDTGIRVCASRIVGEHHRQMTLERESGDNRRHKAILFNVSGRPMTADRFDKIAYRPQWNYWNGKRQLQLIVEAAISGG
jgi:single-stranded-DNA-specific exonuclease